MAKFLDITSEEYKNGREAVLSVIKEQGHYENDKYLLDLSLIRSKVRNVSDLESVLTTMLREKDGIEFVRTTANEKAFYLLEDPNNSRKKCSDIQISRIMSGRFINGYQARIFCDGKSLKQLRNEAACKSAMVRKLRIGIWMADGVTSNRERRVRELEHERDLIEQYLRLTDRKA